VLVLVAFGKFGKTQNSQADTDNGFYFFNSTP